MLSGDYCRVNSRNTGYLMKVHKGRKRAWSSSALAQVWMDWSINFVKSQTLLIRIPADGKRAGGTRRHVAPLPAPERWYPVHSIPSIQNYRDESITEYFRRREDKLPAFFVLGIDYSIVNRHVQGGVYCRNGFLGHEDLAPVYASADVHVSCSQFETLGNTGKNRSGAIPVWLVAAASHPCSGN